MTTLAERIEAADSSQQRELLIEAFTAIIGRAPSHLLLSHRPFPALLDIGTDESFLGAAMTLVPEGWEWALYGATEGFRAQAQLETPAMRLVLDFEPISSFGNTPALALTAAALRAMESKP